MLAVSKRLVTILSAVLAVNLLGICAFLALAAAGWPGAPSRCLNDFVCYCEVPVAGWARQPGNTWSNLACVPAALFVAYDGVAGERARGNPELARLGVVFALALSAQGLGSIFFHASLTRWGAIVDAVSLVSTPAATLAVNLQRIRVLRADQVPWVVLGLALLALGYRLLLLPVMAPLVLLMAIAVVVTERRARRLSANRAARSARWVFGLMAVTVLFWVLSLRRGLPLCSDSFPWGHAVFHVIAAALSCALWCHARDSLRASAV